MHKYGLSIDRFARAFTVVTDRTTVTAHVVNVLVSEEIHNPDETWMSCPAYELNYVMKNFLYSQGNWTALEVVVQDFRSMIKITEDRNRSGLKHLLSDGSKLLQESETRFSTYYQVAERFLKSSN